MSNEKPLGLGLIGCGNFGGFCLEAFSAMECVQIAAVADVMKAPADHLAHKFSVPAYYDSAELISDPKVDLVHIATPPGSHRMLVVAAAVAGKHVLCEKPLALNTAQADEMLAAIETAGTISPVNFVLRYNAVTEAVKAVIESGAIGRVLAARLTNCARDSNLPPEHWFWNKDLSGGIFIEHGVHFFDLYNYWLGPGRVVSAHAEKRQPTGQEDRVTCTIRHDNGTLASHYHGFDQIAPMDRTDHRLICELGDIRVSSWIPMSLSVDAAVNDEAVARLQACCDGTIEVLETFGKNDKEILGRGRQQQVTQRIRLTYSPANDKQSVYIRSTQDLLADQIAYIRNRSHERRITEANGRDAVAMAEAATKLLG